MLTDFERWPEFMPLIREHARRRRVGEKLWVEQRYRIMLVPLAHTTIYELDPRDGRLSWQLDETAPHDIAAQPGRVGAAAGRRRARRRSCATTRA